MNKICLVSAFCLVLVITGIFFINTGYSNESGIIASEPQRDAAASNSNKKAPAANESYEAIVLSPAESPALMKPGSFGSLKKESPPTNDQREYYKFQEGTGSQK